MDGKAIGAKLKKLRGKHTQSDLAKMLGVTKQTIANYEAGRRIPSDDMKIRLAQLYGKSVFNIFFKGQYTQPATKYSVPGKEAAP